MVRMERGDSIRKRGLLIHPNRLCLRELGSKNSLVHEFGWAKFRGSEKGRCWDDQACESSHLGKLGRDAFLM